MKWLVFCFLCGFPSFGFGMTGAISGGGDKGVVCRDPMGKIISAETLDLYEAKARYHLKLFHSSGSLRGDYLQAVRNTYYLTGVAFHDYSAATKNLDLFLNSLHFTRPGQHLPNINDVGRTVPLPQGCDLEQLAVWNDDTGVIRVDSEIWKAMDSLNKAALAEHELGYKQDRRLGEKISEGTRADVAHMFAIGITPVLDGIPASSLDCDTWDPNLEGSPDQLKNSEFFVYNGLDSNLNPVTILQFETLMERELLTKGIAVIPRIAMKFTNSYVPTVVDPNANLDFVTPIIGSQRDNWSVGIRYVNGLPMQLRLYESGRLIETADVTSCTPR